MEMLELTDFDHMTETNLSHVIKFYWQHQRQKL